ncbi:MAG: DUF4255 domain-containing protein [Spirochaetales bacterium]|nr:DUF4255 domain-containing protein [Spirochaetales bacterium]
MDQSDIFQEAIQKFAQKFDDIAKVKIMDSPEAPVMDDQPTILINILGIEELILGNMNERRKLKGVDENGEEYEYFTTPSSLFNISVIVTPRFKTFTDSLKILGGIVRLIKDNNQIPVGDLDWIDNNKRPILIMPVPGMGLEKQMQIFSMLGLDYRPSVFYQFVVGVDSIEKSVFKRVQERKFTAEHKKDTGVKFNKYNKPGRL